MTDPSTPDLAARIAWFVEALGDPELVEEAQSSQAEADDLVGGFVGAENPFGVPQTILNRCILEVAADLFFRRQSRNGVMPFDGGMEAQPLRIRNDPLAGIYPLLRVYIPSGLA